MITIKTKQIEMIDPHACSYNRLKEKIDFVQVFQAVSPGYTKEIVFYCKDEASAGILERALEGMVEFEYFTNTEITGEKG